MILVSKARCLLFYLPPIESCKAQKYRQDAIIAINKQIYRFVSLPAKQIVSLKWEKSDNSASIIIYDIYYIIFLVCYSDRNDLSLTIRA